jgi:hypothetical protein
MQAMIQLANDQANMILYNSAISFRYRIVAIVSAGRTLWSQPLPRLIHY